MSLTCAPVTGSPLDIAARAGLPRIPDIIHSDWPFWQIDREDVELPDGRTGEVRTLLLFCHG